MKLLNSTVSKTVGAAAVASALLLPTQASANLTFGSDMFINTAAIGYNNSGDAGDDGNTFTDVFDQFTFGQLLATSVYFIDEAGEAGLPAPGAPGSDVRLFGSFFDTNDAATLTALGAPQPTGGQTVIDGLKPLTSSSVPGAPTDDLEDFGSPTGWGLGVATDIQGVLTATGPQYTSGTIELRAFTGGAFTASPALTFSVRGSAITGPDLNLFLDVTQAISNFLFIEVGGSFIDIADAINDPSFPSAVIDTNVNPPIPSFNNIGAQALTVATLDGETVAWRQTTLDGSAGIQVPSPGPLALIGVGLFAAGVSRFSKKRKAA